MLLVVPNTGDRASACAALPNISETTYTGAARRDGSEPDCGAAERASRADAMRMASVNDDISFTTVIKPWPHMFAPSVAALFAFATSRVPAGWHDSADAAADATIELTFLLKLPRAGVAALEAELLARADPASPHYGSGWLSNDKVHAMVAPPAEAVDAVTSWLSAESGVVPSRRTPNADILTATVHKPPRTPLPVILTGSEAHWIRGADQRHTGLEAHWRRAGAPPS